MKLAHELTACPECGLVTANVASHAKQAHGVELEDIRTCEHCGDDYARSPGKTDQKYCTPSCARQANRQAATAAAAGGDD